MNFSCGILTILNISCIYFTLVVFTFLHCRLPRFLLFMTSMKTLSYRAIYSCMCTGCLLIGDYNDRMLIILTKTTSLSLGHLLAIISSKTYQWDGQVTRWSLLWELLSRNLLSCFVINNLLVCILILKVSDLLYVITAGHTVTACMLPIANSLTTSPIISSLVTLLLFWSHHFLNPRCLKFGPIDQYINAV